MHTWQVHKSSCACTEGYIPETALVYMVAMTASWASVMPNKGSKTVNKQF